MRTNFLLFYFNFAFFSDKWKFMFLFIGKILITLFGILCLSSTDPSVSDFCSLILGIWDLTESVIDQVFILFFWCCFCHLLLTWWGKKGHGCDLTETKLFCIPFVFVYVKWLYASSKGNWLCDCIKWFWFYFTELTSEETVFVF